MTTYVVAKGIHAGRHASGGADPVTPAAIGAATPSDVSTAVSVEAAARIAGDAATLTAAESYTDTVVEAITAGSTLPPVTEVATSSYAGSYPFAGLPGVIDGVTVALGDLLLLTAQSAGSRNGPWVVASGTWTRPAWFASGAAIPSGSFLTVLTGTADALSAWQVTGSGVIDTNVQTWTKLHDSLATVSDVTAETTRAEAAEAVRVRLVEAPLSFLDSRVGGVIDGVTDTSTAFTTAFGLSTKGHLYLPEGTLVAAGISVPEGWRVEGAGRSATTIQRPSGSTSDMVTLAGQHAAIQSLTLDGNGLSGDGVVVNAAYCAVEDLVISNNVGDGVGIGKASAALITRLRGLILRTNRGHGLKTYSGSSDGQWDSIDVGQSGLAGVALSGGAQQLTKVHSWGNGLEASTTPDKCGFYLNSPDNQLSACESETNIRDGIVISSSGSDRQGISNTPIWGNGAAGIYSFGATKWHRISGCSFRNNAVTNTAGGSSNGFAQINNESGKEWAVNGNVFEDDGSAIPAGSYPSGYIPTNTYPGRSAIFTVARHYAESNTSGVPDMCSFTGNIWPVSLTRTGLANLYVGTNHQQAGNLT